MAARNAAIQSKKIRKAAFRRSGFAFSLHKKTPLKFAKRILPLRGRGYVKEGGSRKMDEIERALAKYGIPERKIGARYLYLGLKRAKESDDKEMIFNLSKKFYPRISEETCLQPKTIETSIRRAVQLSPYFPDLTVHDIIVEMYKEIEPNFFSLAAAARTAAPAAWRAKRDERQKTRFLYLSTISACYNFNSKERSNLFTTKQSQREKRPFGRFFLCTKGRGSAPLDIYRRKREI